MRTIQTVQSFQADQLNVNVYANRQDLGEAAAIEAIAKIKELLANQARVRIVFAAAPSQNEFLETLREAEGIDWSRVTAFHMDEYIGLAPGDPERFSHFLKVNLFDVVKPGEVHLIRSENTSEQECARYAALLTEAPIDIVCLGIGENGHIAFNDPPVADFSDKEVIKPVELDVACRTQQVNDGCFPNFDAVPTHALTLTIPTIMSARFLYCMVPGPTKREAVTNTISAPITTACPATILRKHDHCTLYVDQESYQENG